MVFVNSQEAEKEILLIELIQCIRNKLSFLLRGCFLIWHWTLELCGAGCNLLLDTSMSQDHH